MSNLDFLPVILIALALSADCFTVAFGGSVSIKTISTAQILRAALAFGAFQAVMPVLGWLAGRTIADFVADYDHWVAFILLALVGGRMIWGAFRSEKSQNKVDITRGVLLLTLAVATSIDAFAVGLSFAFLGVNILLACLTIGVIAFGITIVGFVLGRKTKTLLGKYAEVFGGVILIGIGIRIVVSHVM